MNSDLVVKILNIESGLQVFHNVKYVRIISEKYNLLVMKNYLPIIGEIEGSIEISGDEILKYDKIKGYYMNELNEFSIIIKEKL